MLVRHRPTPDTTLEDPCKLLFFTPRFPDRNHFQRKLLSQPLSFETLAQTYPKREKNMHVKCLTCFYPLSTELPVLSTTPLFTGYTYTKKVFFFPCLDPTVSHEVATLITIFWQCHIARLTRRWRMKHRQQKINLYDFSLSLLLLNLSPGSHTNCLFSSFPQQNKVGIEKY